MVESFPLGRRARCEPAASKPTECLVAMTYVALIHLPSRRLELAIPVDEGEAAAAAAVQPGARGHLAQVQPHQANAVAVARDLAQAAAAVDAVDRSVHAPH